MGRGNLLEWFIYCLPSRALKGRHTHPLLSVCVWKTAWVMHYSWNLGMPPKTPSQLKRLLLWFAVCWVNARKLGKREQEGCQSVSFRDVSEWLSFLPPGNFYFRVKEAPLLTKLRKIRAYSRQYLVTWQTPRADPFVFGSWFHTLLIWTCCLCIMRQSLLVRSIWQMKMTPNDTKDSFFMSLCGQPNWNENNRLSEVSYHSPSKWGSWIPVVVIDRPPTVETPTFNPTVCLINTRGIKFLKRKYRLIIRIYSIFLGPQWPSINTLC